jgi:alanine-glyoxylate transaminase/serine-glyoxylate transaminase/serine-pyruvate transaminase
MKSMLTSCTDKYFRIGHMGISVVDPQRKDVESIINALGDSLQEIEKA